MRGPEPGTTRRMHLAWTSTTRSVSLADGDSWPAVLDPAAGVGGRPHRLGELFLGDTARRASHSA